MGDAIRYCHECETEQQHDVVCRGCRDAIIQALRAAAWPGDGEWTRDPAKVEGWYLLGVRHGDFRAVEWLEAGAPPTLCGDCRWSSPLPTMPPVPEEGKHGETDA